MSDTPTFDEIVVAWRVEYNSRIPGDARGRISALCVLFGNLADHGFTKDSLDNGRKRRIMECCYNPGYKKKNNLKQWQSMVIRDFADAMQVYYGTVTIRKDVLTSEMEEKLENMVQKAEETRALASPEREDSELNPDRDMGEEGNIKSGTRTDPETFYIEGDMFPDEEGPVIIWDEDFDKKLGGK